MTSLQHEDELAQSGIFSQNDLEINRSGQLSERQKRKLAFQISFWLGLVALCVVLLAALIALLVAARANILLGLVAVTFILVLISSSREQAGPFQEDLRMDKVKNCFRYPAKGLWGITWPRPPLLHSSLQSACERSDVPDFTSGLRTCT